MANVTQGSPLSPVIDPDTITILETIAQRVLWLSTYMIHYANRLRVNPDGMKVGGHQASCASVVSVMSALYFAVLRPQDHVAVKPHASPVLHAIQYLLGRLPQEKLCTLRDFGGLQAYPSRTKDPDGVTISTGSVGLGAAATIFGALTQRYVRDHFGLHSTPGRYIALVGDAEIDEGNVPEALGEASAYGLSDLWWIVDINRQSLDHIAPEGQVRQIARLFEAKGWEVIWLKYGSKQRAFFERPNGASLQQWIDDCSNAEYQSLLNADGAEIRRTMLEWGAVTGADMARLLADVPDAALKELLMNLGGHDMPQLLQTFAAAAKVQDRPVAILAYTIKGWGLPIAGHIDNHAAQLTTRHMAALQEQCGIAAGHEWEGFADSDPVARWIQHTPCYCPSLSAAHTSRATMSAPQVPPTLGMRFPEHASTQGAFGHILVALSDIEVVAARLVTTSPDVAVSTNLANWINKRGIYAPAERPDYWAKHGITSLLQWHETAAGQHIELGIAENNFFLALAMLGLAPELHGELLLPIGTVYDPFVARGLDALTYATYVGAKFIFAGTPAGLSLSREGGAHQSIYTPLVGMGLPGVLYYEPAYAAELECIMCWGLQQLMDRQQGQSLYLRLSTRPVTQAVRHSTPAWRRQVLAGGYWLCDYRQQPDYLQRPRVHIFAAGVMLEEALQASRMASDEGIYANVINITSADRLFRDYFDASHQARPSYLDELLPVADRQVPAITLLDGHPLALAWLGTLFSAPLKPLGVVNFGETGSLQELYHKHHIDTDAVLTAIVQVLFPTSGTL
ncbi:MAG TPA: 1-deoxy-D-xylulose-5-phosphate synthase N-terminal domain-containing protein [Candidatus Tectomicrobia bacterium]|jgi:pyruvate dehydrogenase E1 component